MLFLDSLLHFLEMNYNLCMRFLIFIVTLILSTSSGYALTPAKCTSFKDTARAICLVDISSKKCFSAKRTFYKCTERRSVKKATKEIQKLPEQFCVTLYEPVCAKVSNGTNSNSTMVEFGNECEASLFGAQVLNQGGCDQICTQIYNPVCALTLFGSLTNYSSKCEARNNGAVVLHRGSCVLH